MSDLAERQTYRADPANLCEMLDHVRKGWVTPAQFEECVIFALISITERLTYMEDVIAKK